jgi:hypothetical protein
MSNETEGVTKKNWFARHKILTGILALFLFFMIIGMIGGSGSSSPANTSDSAGDSPSSGTNTTSEKSTSEPIAQVGDSVTDKDLGFVVVDITTTKTLGNSFTKKDAQGTFQVITLKITNEGKETKTIDSSMFQLTDSEGRTFDRSVEGQSAKGFGEGNVDLFLQQVQPGLSVTGDIVFDIPDSAAGLQLIVKGSIFSSGKKIDLGK